MCGDRTGANSCVPHDVCSPTWAGPLCTGSAQAPLREVASAPVGLLLDNSGLEWQCSSNLAASVMG